ncbi:subtilisin family serine protease [Hamadaea flava]|uniref:S8 family serine peptidase n=1 Tax=Hamadaea flava TaxID=1742688 RepID=A0ABV8LHZ9_9ACTN|nr:S8 family serine peptidase [Hamadaea flava]MCP2325438.1 subtilisin family serine protease [Hamadaea flava]
MSSPSSSRRWRGLAAAGATLAIVAAGLTGPGSPAAADKPRLAAQPVAAKTNKVTLVTGDVVTVRTLVDGTQTATVDRPDSATGGVRVITVHGDLFVLPDEVLPLIAANKVDRRLFDVSDLIEMGYDDAHSSGVPVIASYSNGRAATAAPRGSKLTRRLAAVNGAALTAEKKQARTFWESVAPTTGKLTTGVAKLWLDGKVKVQLAESVPQIGAPQAWAAGYDGHGVKVAVLDTGIDATHPDLVTQVDEKVSFVPGEDTSDLHGHGTHVASTIVGTGAASSGKYKGVAPGADLIVGKVLNNSGEGADSWIIAGMEWAAQSGATVISMSLGSTEVSDGTDPMAVAVDQLSAQYGSLFVIAAGNYGPQTIGSPGSAASALTVGAVDKSDALAYFSSTGPLWKTGGLKPDITGPGVDITAARSQQQSPAEGDGMYWTISGTSMATPHVAGAAAILKQRHPDWSGPRLKDALMSSAKGLADWYTPFEVGTGRVDVANAITTTVDATGSLSYGMYAWPHDSSQQPTAKPVTFRNSGTSAVTLALSVTGGGPFTVSQSSVTVPAGGEATVNVTGPTVDATGTFSGLLLGADAATGTVVTRTALGMVKEDERYDLTVRLRDRSGNPAAGYVVINKAGDFWPGVAYVDGDATYRMQPGTYTLETAIDVAGDHADEQGIALLVAPQVDLTSPKEVVLDATKARKVDIDAPQRVEDRQRLLDFQVEYGDGTGYRDAVQLPVMYDDAYASPTEKVTKGSFTLDTSYRQGEPMLGLTGLGGLLRFDTTVQPGSTLKAGSANLGVVYAGKGSADDFAKVNARGKIAVVERSDDVAPADRAANAAADGAKLLVVVNDGVGRLNEYYDGATIPVATVHRDLGRVLTALAKSGVARLTAKQVPYATYIYDLAKVYTGQIPNADLVYRPSTAQLARIDARYQSVTDQEGGGFRYNMTFTPAVGFQEREWYPGTRTEWVTPGIAYHETHSQGDWEDRGYLNTYRAGSTTKLTWFAPVVHPSFGEGYSVRNSRWQDYLTLNVQAWTASGEGIDHGGSLDWGSVPTHMWLYQGDTLIKENKYSSDMQWEDVPAGNKPYKLVLDASRDSALSTRTHTEWEFFSDTVNSEYFEPLALLELNYLAQTDLRGNLPAGARQPIALTAGPQAGGGGDAVGKVTSVTLEVSYDDGATWQKVSLRLESGKWAGELRLPRQTGFASVRATAVTDAGYTIKQEVIRAYGIR